MWSVLRYYWKHAESSESAVSFRSPPMKYTVPWDRMEHLPKITLLRRIVHTPRRKPLPTLICRSYHKTYGLDVVITRCSNNYGPYQFPEKLIPLMITNALEDIELPVYGDGMNVRDWIHVQDHCRAIDLVLHKGRPGEVYNIGAESEFPNLRIVQHILERLEKPQSLIRFVQDRPGHDRRYAMDASKLKKGTRLEPVHVL